MNNFIDTPPTNEANSVFNAYRLSKPFVHQLNASRLRIASAYRARVTKLVKNWDFAIFSWNPISRKTSCFGAVLKNRSFRRKSCFLWPKQMWASCSPPPLPRKTGLIRKFLRGSQFWAKKTFYGALPLRWCDANAATRWSCFRVTIQSVPNTQMLWSIL